MIVGEKHIASRTSDFRKRLAADRARAGFFGILASLPGLAAAAGIALVVVLAAADGALPLAALLGIFAVLFAIVARWSYNAARAASTPQRVQAMWLRRFQSEGGRAFRASRVIDRLTRHGINALTLQDRDVRLSWEQRRNRLAPRFWLLFVPIAAGVAYLGFDAWKDVGDRPLDLPPPESLEQFLGQLFGAFFMLFIMLAFLIVIFASAILISVAVVMLIAALSGPIGTLFSRNRDDFKQLPRLLKRIEAGKRRGASVLRVSDAHWREAVRLSLKAVDVAIIDLTSVSDHIAWEVGEAVKACGADGLVFICKQDAGGRGQLSPEAAAAVRAALGRDAGAIVYYPATRDHERREAKRFAHDLREAVYAAFERRGGG